MNDNAAIIYGLFRRRQFERREKQVFQTRRRICRTQRLGAKSGHGVINLRRRISAERAPGRVVLLDLQDGFRRVVRRPVDRGKGQACCVNRRA